MGIQIIFSYKTFGHYCLSVTRFCFTCVILCNKLDDDDDPSPQEEGVFAEDMQKKTAEAGVDLSEIGWPCCELYFASPINIF